MQVDERRPDRLIDARSIVGVGSNSAVYRINPDTGIAVAENSGLVGSAFG